MNGRQARGCGMSAHDRTKTITKKTANSIVGKLTAGILATGAVAAVFLAPPAGAQVLVVGDSMEVGSGPHLRAALPGMTVDLDAEKGRTSGAGAAVVAELLRPDHEVVVFPMGTNDLSADALASSFAAVAGLAGGRCVVVATLVRRDPPADELNRVVESFAATGPVQVADWRTAAESPGVLGRDGTHATGAGYALRGGLLAEAVQACRSGGGGASGIPAPRDPDVRIPSEAQRDAGRPGRAPAAPPARPLRLPVPETLVSLASMLRRAVSPVVAAIQSAQTAAAKAAPEPVLGAP
jgi:hypothetical protein